MPYASQDQLQDAAGGAVRFLALTDWDGDNAIDASVVAAAQISADGWIDGFIPAQYSPPLANPSEELQDLAAAEAIYRIRCKREMVSQQDLDFRKERERYLESIRSGKVRPDALAATKSAAVRSGVVKMDDGGGEHSIDRHKLKGMW